MRGLIALTFAFLALAPSALAAPVFFVEGRGWGHGIGMPQYGAYGYALKEGKSYDWILAHYYRGTTLGETSVNEVRILLADDRGNLSIGANTAFTVTDANDKTYRLPAGSVQLGPALKIEVGGETKTLASPARFMRGAQFLELGGRPYRGALVVRSSGGTLSAVNHVGLEEYLYGVVPDEMPSSWAMEALKAQAVAARSYAVVSRRTGGVFDLFSDTRSQVYGGVVSEEARSNAAIDATAGRVVMHNGRVAYTFFHSTSGGRTAAIQDVWNADPITYLVSVADPYDSLSPHHRWGPIRHSAAGLARRLGSLAPRGRLVDLRVTRNGSQRVESVRASGSGGGKQFSGSSFQSRLGLRSAWFSISVLSLGGDRRIEYGAEAALRGIARGPRTVSLERRTGSGRWERVLAVDRGEGGAFRLAASPAISTWFRLSWAKGKGDPFRVAVAPWVRLSQLRADGTLLGRVRPARAGVGVELQRFANGRWDTLASVETNASGRFRAQVPLRPGGYRAVARVGAGYVPGISPVLQVAVP
jgi:stage II sporulation protein D